MTRLNKYLASCGVASRRACDELIAQARVTVNGQVVTAVGTRIDEQRDEVAVDGRVVKPPSNKVYVMLHKPRGYVTTVRDTRGRPKVTDLVPTSVRLFPVGRLDIDTEGLLLLTNDGDMANRLLHPRFKVAKTYVAVVDREVSEQQLTKLRAGLALADGMTAPCEARLLGQTPPLGRVVELTLREGRKRQVRRMLAAVGLRVLVLRRTGFGPLHLGRLGVGEWRYLAPDEEAALRTVAQRAPAQEDSASVEPQVQP